MVKQNNDAKEIIETPAHEELASSYLRYSMSVVYSRAIPAIDGLKPVQRRILYGMHAAGWTNDKSYVKVSRAVGEVMGKLHPHGDSSIGDALVKLGQDFYLNIPLIQGYGNFGDPSGSPAAAARYIESRLSKAADFTLREIKEDTVDFKPNYDGTFEEPLLLPVMFPVLLVNGNFGIGVGFASKFAPHNLGEAIDATKYLVKNPNAPLEKVMKYIPGPDFPTGAQIIGIDAIKEAYATGKGIFRLRARSSIAPLTRGKHEIVFTELPYGVSTESIIVKVRELINQGKLLGVADAKDLTDRKNGLRVVIETKAGSNPQVVLAELLKETPLEDSFGINNMVLVNGQPKTVGLIELIQLFIEFRKDIIVRRSHFRKTKREERLHLVEGLLKALANIDEVIRIVRAAADATAAQTGLMKKFKVDELQADYILSIPLRRLTKFDSLQLTEEKKRLEDEIKDLQDIITDPARLQTVLLTELDEVKKAIPSPRKSEIVGGTLAEHLETVKEAASAATSQLEIADEPCFVTLTAKRGLVRTNKVPNRANLGTIETTTRGRFILVTNLGRGFKVDTLHVGERETKVDALLSAKLPRNEFIVAVAPLALEEGKTGGIAMGTRNGVVKIAAPLWPKTQDEFPVIGLDKGDEVVGARWVPDVNESELVFISTDTSVLPYSATKVRPQGLSGGGMAGIKLSPGQQVSSFSVIHASEKPSAVIVTATAKTIKATPFAAGLYPQKGRATGGYSSHSLLKGEEGLVVSGVAPGGAIFTPQGVSVPLPALTQKRVASGSKLEKEGIF